MVIFLVFLGFLAANLLVAAALVPPLHQFLAGFVEIDPDRMLYRLAMLLALIGFWPLLRRLHLANRRALGLAQPWPQLRREILAGFLWGLAILTALSLLLLAADVRPLRPWNDTLAAKLAGTAVTALVSGLLVGIIEETFFRGAMFEGIRRHRGPVVAGLLTAVLYAALHFVRPAEPPPGPLGWDAGFGMLAGAFERYRDFPAIADSFFALVTVGLFLALVRWRTGSIAAAIGLHAGWVYVIMLTRRVTTYNPDAAAAGLVGNYDFLTGWLAAAWLLLLGGLYWRHTGRHG